MAYQHGFANPDPYAQDNSGVAEDTTTTIEYTPEQFGAPDGARIMDGSVHQQISVQRGPAEVRNLKITETSVTFDVWTAAAGGFPFGHHSGWISVTTSFQWYFED